jgi:hypothetical protein
MDFALLVPIVGQFMLHPLRTVLATTKEQLDAALATADQITVEGDDELLSYAVNKASNDPENRVSVEIGEHLTTVAPREAEGFDAETWAYRERTMRERAAREAEAERKRRADIAEVKAALEGINGRAAELKPLLRGPRVRYLVLALAGLLVLGLGLLGRKLYRATGRGAAPGPNPDLPPGLGINNSDFWANLPSLLWPVVAIVAIVALFLIARQAISTDRNVTICWKVTEKVTGRVVITKVKEPSARKPKAA